MESDFLLQEKLPKASGGNEPLPEGLLWLLLSGNLPTPSQVKQLTENLRSRSKLPEYVYQLLRGVPKHTHPMTQFSMAVLALQPDSLFAKAYTKGEALCMASTRMTAPSCKGILFFPSDDPSYRPFCCF
jgi:citrate synthase